jgi:hypothetical protein
LQIVEGLARDLRAHRGAVRSVLGLELDRLGDGAAAHEAQLFQRRVREFRA